MYYTNSLLEYPVLLDAINQRMDAVLSRRWHLAGRIVCDSLSRRKAWGLLLSGLMAATTTILFELDPFFMLLDPNFRVIGDLFEIIMYLGWCD